MVNESLSQGSFRLIKFSRSCSCRRSYLAVSKLRIDLRLINRHELLPGSSASAAGLMRGCNSLLRSSPSSSSSVRLLLFPSLQLYLPIRFAREMCSLPVISLRFYSISEIGIVSNQRATLFLLFFESSSLLALY